VLREITDVRQIPGDPRRRWFTDESMDLYAWLDEKDEIAGFQLTYGKPFDEKALTWKRGGIVLHTRVEEGASPGKYPGSPLLMPDGAVDADHVLREFKDRAKDIEWGIVECVTVQLSELPRGEADS